MSFKFRRDGAVFATEVKDGKLLIHVGDDIIQYEFKFLTEDFDYNVVQYDMCNVMCYLENNNHIIVMRFDGTVTKFNKDLTVVGFSKFDKDLIYRDVIYLPVGTVAVLKDSDGDDVKDIIQKHIPCSIYRVRGGKSLVFECMNDPETITFYEEENGRFCEDLLKGTRYYPRLIRKYTNFYIEDKGRYVIEGKPTKVLKTVYT